MTSEIALEEHILKLEKNLTIKLKSMRTASKDFGLATIKAKEIMGQALYELDNEFTSDEFVRVANYFKLDKTLKAYATRSKAVTQYLKDNCIHIENRQWRKNV